MPIGRVRGDGVSSEDVDIADREGLRCVYLLLDAAGGPRIRGAEDLGFRVIDFRITLGRPVAGARDAEPVRSVRPTQSGDLQKLERIAAGAHEDSRFFMDDRFDRAAVQELYVKWLRDSLEGRLAEFTLSAIQGEEAVGYITGQAASDPDVLSIGLLAVSPSARGRGLGRALISSVLVEAERRGYTRVEVVTQGSNIAAQRVYQALGFRTVRAEVWLHRWAPSQV